MPRHGLLYRLAATLVVLLLFGLGWLTPLRNTINDARFRLTPRSPSALLVLVEIDARSIAAIGSWPWDRSVHAQLLDRLREAGVSDVAFDVDFSSPLTASGDAAFVSALRRANGSTILAAMQQSASTRSDGTLVTRPLRAFADEAWEASVNARSDEDGVVRSFARGYILEEAPVPSLATQLVGGDPNDTRQFLGDFGIEVGAMAHVSAVDVLSGKVNLEQLRGRKAIIGATASELRDFFQVPRFGTVPGLYLHALAAQSMLGGRTLQPVPVVVTALICCLVFLCSWLVRRLDLVAAIITTFSIALVLEGAAVLLQKLTPFVLDTSAAHVELLALAVLAVLIEADSRRIKILVSRGNADRLRMTLDHVIADSFAGVIIVDQDGIVRATSEVVRSLLKLGDADVTDLHYSQFVPDVLRAAIENTQARARMGDWSPDPPREAECLIDGGSRPRTFEYVTTVSRMPGPITDSGKRAPDQHAICLTFQDVTERRQAEAEIARVAHFDSLTGLANRHSFLSRAEAALADLTSVSGCLAVLSFDLDRFKLVNDRLGHNCGDALLQAVAERVRAVVEVTDIVARLGGDEFAMILERAQTGDVERFAERLVESVSGVYAIGAYQITVGISLGLAFAEGVNSTTILKRADTALYAAKAAGGNRVKIFDAAMEEHAEAAVKLEEDLRHAVERDEFEVVYQRQVDAGSERIVGVEALVRWKHPARGYVSPVEFIPVAERTGLIEGIGAWVLRTACREAMTWPRPIKLSVNLSAVQLSRGDLVQTVARALADSALPPARLDLELTESLLMENAGFARGILNQIRQLGVGLSLDDFGTGYSSLAYLKSFDIDKIKIDRSFVRDLPDDTSSIAIIRAVASLAQSLGLRLNAEGVETVEQLNILRDLGCDEIQGFLHGRAEPSNAIAASLMREREYASSPERLQLAC